jgi:uncharacterized SAM-binding protein YcdF (DUF218 family)
MSEPGPDLRAIARYLDVHTGPAPADLAFVFGTRLPDPVPLALALYRQGLAPLIVLTGGPNRLTGVVEAHAHRDALAAAGVAERDMLVEDRSTNTLENVTLALPLLAGRLEGRRVSRVLAVVKWYHSRRALMTLRAHLPAGVRYYAATYEPPGLGRAEWHTHEQGRQQVLGNWQAIPRYRERGHLHEIERDGDAYV